MSNRGRWGLLRRAAMVALVSLWVAIGCMSSKSASDQEQARLAEYILDERPSLRHPVNISFDDKVELLGYELTPNKGLKQNGKVRVTFYWRVKQQLDSKDWLLFTHLLDGNNQRILNVDNVGPLRSSPRDRSKQALPPGYWVPGKVYVDKQEFRMPQALNTDSVKFVVGIWRNKERLPVRSGPSLGPDRGLVVEVPVIRSLPVTKVPKRKTVKLEAGRKIVIDGKLDDAGWEDALNLSPFVDAGTGETPAPEAVQGDAKVTWSDEFLYVGFTVKDKDVRGGFPKDAVDPHLWERDTVEIMLEPDGEDNEDYYEIQVNPQNLVFDSQFDDYNKPRGGKEGPFGHQDWSAKLISAVTVNGTLDDSKDADVGYVVEVAIPWSSLSVAKRAPPAHQDTWRVNLYIMEDNGGVAWSPILRQGNFHKSSRFGKLVFLTAPEPEKPEGVGGAGPGLVGAGGIGAGGAPAAVSAGGSATGGNGATGQRLPRRLENPMRLKQRVEEVTKEKSAAP